MNNLALLLGNGQDLMQDEAEARILWAQSANLGHTNAMMNLGLSYLRAGNQEKGGQWVVRAAQSGPPDAQKLVRANGYRGPLPQPYDQAARMVRAPRNEVGHSKVCGAFVS